MSKTIAAAFISACLLTLVAGVMLESKFRWVGSSGKTDMQAKGEREILYWVAPMDPNYRRDGPGKSPMGMDLIPFYAGATNDSDDAIEISSTVENNLGVRTAMVRSGPLPRRIAATGYVGFDETRISHIHLRTEGWIERLRVASQGERVEQGQLLFDFYAPAIVNAQKEYLQAQRRGDPGLLEAADAKLKALGVATSDIAALAQRGTSAETIRVVAPRSGVVSVLNVREGMHVTPATVVMSLADLSSVWLNAEIFESQIDWVVEEQPAEARLSYLPAKIFKGRVDYVYPILDAMARTLKVRLRFDNPGERLKPNMYAQVTIFGGAENDVLRIPREALIRSGATDRVVMALGEGQFRVQEVDVGIESGEWVEVRRGLSAADRVVTSAQFLLDSEASLRGSIRRLNADDKKQADAAIIGQGVIQSMSGQTVTLAHEPIAVLGWPAMTMQFELADGASSAGLDVGGRVRFLLQRDAADGYRIVTLDRIQSAVDPSGRDHD